MMQPVPGVGQDQLCSLKQTCSLRRMLGALSQHCSPFPVGDGVGAHPASDDIKRVGGGLSQGVHLGVVCGSSLSPGERERPRGV